MRKIVAATFMSLDGVIQGPGSPEEDPSGGFELGGWTVPFGDETTGAFVGETFAGSYDLVLGRKTYDLWASYWPLKEVDRTASAGAQAMGKAFGAVTKYVATHAPGSLNWKNSEALGKDAVARLRELKQGQGPRMVIQGSSILLHTMLELDLVDEFRLLIYPVVLGKGKRFFGEASLPASFKVTQSKTSSKGVLAVVYERAGEVKTGTYNK